MHFRLVAFDAANRNFASHCMYQTSESILGIRFFSVECSIPSDAMRRIFIFCSQHFFTQVQTIVADFSLPPPLSLLLLLLLLMLFVLFLVDVSEA